MVDIQSKEVIDKISDELKIQPAMDIPRALAKEIQLTYNVNPRRAGIIASNTRSTNGASAVFTTDLTRDFFLTSAVLGYNCTAAADTVLYELETTINGVTTDILTLGKQTLTIQNQIISLVFPVPILLDKNATILIRQTFIVGNSNVFGAISGFNTDPQ